MNLIFTIAFVVVAQTALWAMHHFGEMDAFWYAVLLVISVPLSLAALVFGWAASVDWSK